MKARKLWGRRSLSAVLSAALVLSGTGFGPVLKASAEETTVLTEEQVAQISSGSRTRTSVHDPSVVYDGVGTYYVFGSHMAVSKTTDLENWTAVTSESLGSSLFASAYDQEFEQNSFTGEITVTASVAKSLVAGTETEEEVSEPSVTDNDGRTEVTVETETGDSLTATVNFGSYNIEAWIADNTIQGNMWAPDVIYNPAMGKWCMYLSLNGATWNSAIVLLTADSIEGPYDYVGPVVFSGFSLADSSKSFHDTDLELVIGAQDELPAKYQQLTNGSNWGSYWPHAIDPAVLYDDDGNLWLVYGSWSGGIYMLELDEESGLRDYTVSYEDTSSLGVAVTSDPYFGTKIAGGDYVSGEGSYIQKIGEYYYLFISYGFYSPEGGYNMRVFRSENVNGPYTDENGKSPIFSKYVMNYDATNSSNNRGEKLMGGYQWDTMSLGEISQGHNSAIVTEDGKAFVVYHTKFNDGTAGHEVRVHQLFVNENGWLVTAPYEYAGETLNENGYSMEDLAGSYEVIFHPFQTAYSSLEVQTPLDVTLNGDGTISGAYSGTWSLTSGTPYAQLTIDGATYRGVFVEQAVTGNVKAITFTAVSSDGLSVWGTGEYTDESAVALTAADSSFDAPLAAFDSFELATEGLGGATISWASSDPSILSASGEILSRPETDTAVTLHATISKGNCSYVKSFAVTVFAQEQNHEDSVVLGRYFTGESVNLADYLNGSLSVRSPFYEGTTAGVDLSGGVTVEFDVVSNGSVNVLGTIFSFLGTGGKLYFTPGSYLGYNATGGWYDANLNSYALVKDYIGDSAHVAVNLRNDGFTVTVNGEVAYTEEILATDNGDGTLTDYTKVLDWLQSSADTMYFGYGSWWTDVAANVELSNVVCTVSPTAVKESVVTEDVAYSRDLVELTSTDYIEYEENPFYGKIIDNATLKYTINMTDGTAQNGWDGIFSFYNSSTGSRVSLQTAPYLCFNSGSGSWMDVNQPGSEGGTDLAPSMVPGTEYEVVISITADGVTMTVDGQEIALGFNSSGAAYQEILDALMTNPQLTFGVGLAVSAYWNTEICTLTDIEFTSVGGTVLVEGETEEEETQESNLQDFVWYEKDAVELATNADLTVEENPFYGKNIDNLTIQYTINMKEGAARNGWDGILSFYNSATGGRVSVQTAPYVCYNDGAGKWIDLNNPNLGGDDMAPAMEEGTDHAVKIVLTDAEVHMYVDGAEINIGESGSGATYADLLDFVTTCDELCFGVGQAAKSYWWTETCDLKNLKLYSTGSVELETNADLTTVENPFYGEDLDHFTLEYTINMTQGTAQNGWDGILSFTRSGDANGRLSIQTAPYICYNDWAGNWIDINQPGAEGATNMAPAMTAGTDHDVKIVITEDNMEIYVDGEAISYSVNGSGAAYGSMLDYIASCDELSYGVGLAAKAFWNTEGCTLTNILMYETAEDAEELPVQEESLLEGSEEVTLLMTEGTASLDVALTVGDNTLTYASSDESVVTVDENGLLTAVAAGDAVVTVAAEETDAYLPSEFAVTVHVMKADQVLEGTESMTLARSMKNQKLDVVLTTGDGALSYATSNKKVVTVSADGSLKLKGVGTAVVTVTAAETDCYNAASMEVTITVTRDYALVNGEKVFYDLLGRPARGWVYSTSGTYYCNNGVPLKGTYRSGLVTYVFDSTTGQLKEVRVEILRKLFGFFGR